MQLLLFFKSSTRSSIAFHVHHTLMSAHIMLDLHITITIGILYHYHYINYTTIGILFHYRYIILIISLSVYYITDITLGTYIIYHTNRVTIKKAGVLPNGAKVSPDPDVF